MPPCCLDHLEACIIAVLIGKDPLEIPAATPCNSASYPIAISYQSGYFRLLFCLCPLYLWGHIFWDVLVLKMTWYCACHPSLLSSLMEMRRTIVLVEILFCGGWELGLWLQIDQEVNRKNGNNVINSLEWWELKWGTPHKALVQHLVYLLSSCYC